MRPSVVAGAAACGVAGVACAWSVAAALRVGPAAPSEAGAGGGASAAAVTPLAPAGPGADEPDLDRTLDRDPFRSDRRRPPRRFVPPGTPTAAPRVTVPAVSLTLTGTVIYPDGGGLALVRAVGRSPVMVRVGEMVEGLTLRSVARDEATFVRPGGGFVVLRVPKAGG